MKHLVRCIAPKWLNKPTLEGEFDESKIADLNASGYNIFTWPNSPSAYDSSTPVNGTHITQFSYVFVDYDLKSNVFASKDDFIASIDIPPTKIVDSGNGVHVYWKVSDLDANSYLRLQRRLVRKFNTDEATCNIAQLMRLPGTLNTKNPDNLIPCELLFEEDSNVYTCEQLDGLLPAITLEDEKFCQQHYNKTYNVNRDEMTVDNTLPPEFGKLLRENPEVKELWAGLADDRSKNDFRLGHLMFANGFAKEQAASVLVNSAKALQRAPVHRVSYAMNIIDKIWTFEAEPNKEVLNLSHSVKEILQKSGNTIKGTRFACHECIDNTQHGFRLGQVIGLVAGSGVGKTAFSMNMFKWFIERNPDYHHFFIPLEQPANEIADRWNTMCAGDTSLNDKVHVLSNYDDEGNFRHLSLSEIQDYLVNWQKATGKKIGCVVIDHIGALKKKGSKDENQDLITICHSMKAFAVQTNTLVVMQSQSSREKAGIGDLELNKDAAYGTIFFESYCDYLITLWQPLKRCHSEDGCPTVTAFKFCKIRHKKAKRDIIKEDVPYYLCFDSETELMKDMTQDEETSFNFFLPKATNKRKADRKSELLTYQSVPYKEGAQIATAADSSGYARRH
jgi:KaiC/GvpD/RAD55 family RecA-like ATPase